jgi:predicted aspartyl protease
MLIRVPILIGKDASSLREVVCLVDTGAFYTILPPTLAQELEIETTLNVPVILADNRTAEMGMGLAYVRVLEREAGIPVGIMNAPEPLFGVTALEALGLKVNPVAGTLEYERPYGLAVLGLRTMRNGR